jgi:hypothetical protein
MPNEPHNRIAKNSEPILRSIRSANTYAFQEPKTDPGEPKTDPDQPDPDPAKPEFVESVNKCRLENHQMTRLLILATLAAASCAAQFDLPQAFSADRPLRTETLRLTGLKPGIPHSLLYSVPPQSLPPSATIRLELSGATPKTLHAGDPDLYLAFTPTQPNPELRITATGANQTTAIIRVNRLPNSPQINPGGNHTWQTAAPIELGKTLFASADETEYIPLPATTRKAAATAPRAEQWYKFHFSGPAPKLVFFHLELTDRDDLPVDVSVFEIKNNAPIEYTKGQDPVAVPHEVQALPGNKFAPRLFDRAGDFYLRVRAAHPEYKLRTRLYNPPPYADPREAVRTAIDYILGAGDSWFANTPRRGGTLDRVTPVHQETSLCVSCHPAHFSQRAQLIATANGYPVVQRQQLQFLQDRFYNNPRPFYGFEDQGAVWARVISAPANVLSRMAILTDLFETQVSRQPRPAYRQTIASYLNLYFANRTQLPPDETNGNTPLVSAFEVAWYSWKTTHDPKIPALLAAAEIKNMNDLGYQTLALTEIDPSKYKLQIEANAARILSLQRPDGQWSMKFDPTEPEVEFATGHALWALCAAGIPASEPHVAKAIAYLLNRQQTFGGWMDPLQSYENFRTPFRETQFAAVALSSYFPLPNRPKGWNSPTVSALSTDPVTLLNQLYDIWDPPTPAVLRQIEQAAASNETLIRQAAAETLGRLANPSDLPLLAKLLADPSKLVQRTGANSLRQIYSIHPETPAAELLAALRSPDSRARLGATRVFAHHFAALARRDDMVEALARLAESDPVLAIRMNAIRGLWQAWFWNAGDKKRNRIEDVILAGLKTPQHPWLETSLHAAVYNLADENIRYLYNNWVTLLPNQSDRDRAIAGRLAIEARLAGKFAAILTGPNDFPKKQLLAALTDVKQRRADIYDLESDLSSDGGTAYNRIGNDIEQIAFFGTSATTLAKALDPLINSKDTELAHLARNAALMVRETPYAHVEKAAGGRSPEVIALGDHADVPGFHIVPPKPAAAPAATTQTAKATLDEPYFRAKIQPILEKKGEDGYACINCHVTHTLFNAKWETVMNVVDTKNPENSLLLRKPTSTAESEGVVGAKATAHGGGRRWPKNSPEYDAILHWIQGATQEPVK